MISLYVLGFVGNFASKILINEKRDELINYFNVEFINHVESQLDESLNEGGFNPSLIMPNCNGEYCEPNSNTCNGEHCEPNSNTCRGEHCEPAILKVVDTEPIGKGGALTALWKICDRNKWGLKYSLRKIPILQGTVEIANYFDLNPYRLLTKNSYVVAAVANKTAGANNNVGASTASPLTTCVMASITSPHTFSKIGYITNEKKRVRIDGETEAFLTKDYKDEIDKVIPNYIKKMGLV